MRDVQVHYYWVAIFWKETVCCWAQVYIKLKLLCKLCCTQEWHHSEFGDHEQGIGLSRFNIILKGPRDLLGVLEHWFRLEKQLVLWSQMRTSLELWKHWVVSLPIANIFCLALESCFWVQLPSLATSINPDILLQLLHWHLLLQRFEASLCP